jgi:hypothetical protein
MLQHEHIISNSERMGQGPCHGGHTFDGIRFEYRHMCRHKYDQTVFTVVVTLADSLATLVMMAGPANRQRANPETDADQGKPANREEGSETVMGETALQCSSSHGPHTVVNSMHRSLGLCKNVNSLRRDTPTCMHPCRHMPQRTLAVQYTH